MKPKYLSAGRNLAFILVMSFLQASSVFSAGSVEMQVGGLLKMAIRAYNQGMLTGDPAGWLKYHTKDIERTSFVSGQKGIEELTAYYQWEFETFEAKYTVKKQFVHGRTAAVEFSWDAVHKPSGRSISLDMVGIYELSPSGKFKSATYYFDSAKANLFLEEVSTASQ